MSTIRGGAVSFWNGMSEASDGYGEKKLSIDALQGDKHHVNYYHLQRLILMM